MNMESDASTDLMTKMAPKGQPGGRVEAYTRWAKGCFTAWAGWPEISSCYSEWCAIQFTDCLFLDFFNLIFSDHC